MLEEATRAWPDCLPRYDIGMRYTSPKWGGSFSQVDAVARFALENNRDVQGPAIYAAAYERFLRYNPDASHTLKDIGLACQMRDREEARRLYLLYEKQNPGVPPDPADACRVFAMSL